MFFCQNLTVSSTISGIFTLLIGGKGALVGVARCGLDGDDMRAWSQR